MNQDLPDISIGDFAMSILNDMAKDPNGLKPALKESTIQSANVPDVSKIQVSNDFVELVTEGKKLNNKIVQSKQKVVESRENRLESLVNQLSTLLVEAKNLVKELKEDAPTTCGNIGMNVLGKPKRNSDPFKKLIRKRLRGI